MKGSKEKKLQRNNVIPYLRKIMKIKNIIAMAAMSLLLTGCGLYKKYEQKVEAPANVFGNMPEGSSIEGRESLPQM